MVAKLSSDSKAHTLKPNYTLLVVALNYLPLYLNKLESSFF